MIYHTFDQPWLKSSSRRTPASINFFKSILFDSLVSFVSFKISCIFIFYFFFFQNVVRISGTVTLFEKESMGPIVHGSVHGNSDRKREKSKKEQKEVSRSKIYKRSVRVLSFSFSFFSFFFFFFFSSGKVINHDNFNHRPCSTLYYVPLYFEYTFYTVLREFVVSNRILHVYNGTEPYQCSLTARGLLLNNATCKLDGKNVACCLRIYSDRG